MTHIGDGAVPRPYPHGRSGSTLPELLALQATTRGDAVALLHKRHGIWQTWNWRQVAETAGRWAAALSGLGVERGATVAIAGANQPRLLLAMLACQIHGAVPVLVPPPGAGVGLVHALAAHPCRVVFAAGEHEVHALHAVFADLPVQPIVICDDLRGLRSLWADWMLDWDSFDAGAVATTNSVAISPSSTAAIVYAAGDADAVRPIVLPHRTLVSAAGAVAEDYAVGAADRSVLATPLGWPMALLLGPVLSLISGASLALPESDATVLSDVREAGPTLLFGPPLLFRQIRQAGYRRVAVSARPWRGLLDRALGLTQHDGATTGVLTRVLLRALRDRLGLTRLRAAISTEEPLPPQIAAFFAALGIETKVFADPSGDRQDSALSGSVFIRAAYTAMAADGAAIALVAPDIDAIALWAQQRGETVRSTEEIAGLSSVQTLLASEIAAVSPKIARFLIVPAGLTLASGEVSPDGVLRRETIERLHRAALDRLQSGDGHAAKPAPLAEAPDHSQPHAVWAMQTSIGIL